MVYRGSFSQYKNYKHCPRLWTYEKVMKIVVQQDLCYCSAGNVLHHSLEQWYNKNITNLSKLKKYFNKEWDSFKLFESKISNKKDEYYLMVLNGVNLEITPTTCELKIYYPEWLGYLDNIDINNGIISDWKSSTRRPENEIEYSKQLMMYAYFYHKRIGTWPKKLQVIYNKYNGSKQLLEVEVDINKIQTLMNDYYKVISEMEEIQKTKKLPDRCEKCYIFCPYKSICFAAKKFEYNIENKGSYLQLDIDDLFLEKHLEKKFSYESKSDIYLKKKYPSMNTFKTLYNKKANTLPTGLLKELYKTLNDYGEYKKEKVIIDYRDDKIFNDEKLQKIESLKGITLYKHQEEAVGKFLISDYKRNIINIATGAGKTIIALELIRLLRMKTIFIVDRRELYIQSLKKLKELFPDIEIGEICSGTFEPKTVTVGMMQTITRNLDKYKDYLGLVRFAIFDEGHKTPAHSYYKINKHLSNVEYVLGITATDYRDDGLDLLINAVCGYPCYKLESSKLIAEKKLIEPRIIFVKDFDGTNYKQTQRELENIFKEKIKQKHGALEGKELANVLDKSRGILYKMYNDCFIVNNKTRNDEIKKVVDRYPDRKKMILVKFVDHGKYLSEQLDIPYISGKTSKKNREIILTDFRNNKINAIIGTYSIFSEGIDIPDIDFVMNVTGNSGNVKTIQILGRGLRTSKGKEDVLYYDFVDPYKFFNLSSVKRMRALRKEGYKLEYE